MSPVNSPTSSLTFHKFEGQVDSLNSSVEAQQQPVEAAEWKVQKFLRSIAIPPGRTVLHNATATAALNRSRSMPMNIPGRRDPSLLETPSSKITVEEQNNASKPCSSLTSTGSVRTSENATSYVSSANSYPNVFVPPADLKKNDSETRSSNPETPPLLTAKLQRCKTLPLAHHNAADLNPSKISHIENQFAAFSPFSSRVGSPSTPTTPNQDDYKNQPWL